MRRLLNLALASALSLPAAGCFNLAGDCKNTVVKSIDAPDGRWRAVLFERSCGATTGFTTQISILAKGAPVKGSGNVFVADQGDPAYRTAWGGPWADMAWTSARSLNVDFDGRAKVFVQEPSHRAIRIQFAPRRLTERLADESATLR